MTKLFMQAIIIVFSFQNLFSQIVNYNNNSVPAQTTENFLSQNISQQDFSNEELSITNEMEILKRQNTGQHREKLCELQKKLELISGRTSTSPGTVSIVSSSQDLKSVTDISDAISINAIYNSFPGSIKAIATQVEQSYPDAGTIWVVVAAGRSDAGVGTSPDTIIFFNSTNNGSSYSMIKRIALSTGMKVKSDQMDLEIIEPDTGSTYLHLVLGFIKDGYTGRSGVGLISLNKSNMSSAGVELLFPGNNITTNKYSKPRITSDNTKFLNDAYITIVVTQDSVDSGTNYILTKLCRIINPYTVSPLITYLTSNFAVTFYGTSETAQTDIAFYSDAASLFRDSLVFVQSGFPMLEHVVLIYKSSSLSFNYPVARKALIDFSHRKEYARIGSNGGVYQRKMMIVYTDNFMNGSDNLTELNTYKTTDGVNWSKSTLIGGFYDFYIPKNPDIIGKRFTDGKFNITFKTETPLKDEFTSLLIEDQAIKWYNFDLNTVAEKMEASPKPGFRFSGSDSALTVFPSSSGVYSFGGTKIVSAAVRFYIEGMYEGNNFRSLDIATAYLRNTNSPYNIIDSSQAYNFNIFPFTNSLAGSYYFSVRTRNALETWYYTTVTLRDSINDNINMYLSSSYAYGNNMKLVDSTPVTYGIYSGDINNDGTVDVSDVLKIYNDARILMLGYVPADLNGDNFVDSSDLIIAYNNMVNIVSVIRP